MNVNDSHFQLANHLPATINLVLENPADAWFAIAAIITLWAYVMLAPSREEQES